MTSLSIKSKLFKVIDTMRKISNVNCAKGCVDKTPKFMEERIKVLALIDSVYKKHDAEKLETPVFELKEVYSNKRNKFDRILDLNDQGGEILSMRYDLKSSLTRYLAMCKIEKHIRISQFGNVYRKEPINYEECRLREFFVSDFDVCGPSDSMLSEVQCLRVACDIAKVLQFEEQYTLKIGHRKLSECCFQLATKSNDSQAVKIVSKLADASRRSLIDWPNVPSIIADNKILSTDLEIFKKIVDTHTGNLLSMIELLQSNVALNGLKEMKFVMTELSQLNDYCKSFLAESDYNKIQLDLSLVGPRSYYTGMTFAMHLNDADKNVLSGGRYDNLIARINPKSKFKTSCTGFSLGVDQLVFHRLLKSGASDLIVPNEIAEYSEDLHKALEKTRIDTQIKTVTEKTAKMSEDDNILKNVKGTMDRNPQQMTIRETVFDTIVRCFQRHNASTIDTPVIERKDVLIGKYGEDSKLIYDLNEVDNEELSLRYDLTVPFARYLAMHSDVIDDGKVFKRYQIGKVYRRDKPSISSGRYREFYQCDFDIAGSTKCQDGDNIDDIKSMAPDAECLQLVYEILRDLNLGDFKIKINHRKFLDGLFEVCGVPDTLFRAVCSSVDKLDKTPWAKVFKELIDKGLSQESATMIGQYVSQNGTVDLIDKLEKDSVLYSNANVRESLKELRQLFGHCDGGIVDKVSFDLSLARGLDYYTGMIFEAVFIGFESRQQDGETGEDDETNQSVGSVSGGGRYDNLVNMFSSSDVSIPCVGLSIGVERLMAIYEKKMKANQCASSGTVATEGARRKTVVVMTAQNNMANERLKLLSMLLDEDIAAVHSMKKNTKSLDVFQECERLKIEWAVIIGEDELAADCVKLRHIGTRKEEMVPRADIVARLRRELQ